MKKKLFKVLLAFVLVFSATLPLISTSVDAAKKVSYLMNTKKSYTYTYHLKGDINNDSVQRTFDYWGKEDGIHWWTTEDNEFGFSETKQGLYFHNSATTSTKFLAYPIKKNETWTEDEETTYKITSVNKTIKTKAGTFKNVVEVKSFNKGSKEYILLYFAPNVGYILSKENSKDTKFKTKTIEELIKLKNI